MYVIARCAVIPTPAGVLFSVCVCMSVILLLACACASCWLAGSTDQVASTHEHSGNCFQGVCTQVLFQAKAWLAACCSAPHPVGHTCVWVQQLVDTQPGCHRPWNPQLVRQYTQCAALGTSQCRDFGRGRCVQLLRQTWCAASVVSVGGGCLSWLTTQAPSIGSGYVGSEQEAQAAGCGEVGGATQLGGLYLGL